MRNQSLTTMNLQLFADADAPATVPAQPGTTSPQTGTVDIDAIVTRASATAEAAASRKMETVFKSMLQQNGLDVDTIGTITAEWKAKNKPEETARPEVSPESKVLLERIEKLERANTEQTAQLTEKQQIEYLKSWKSGELRLPDDQLDFYHFKISKMVGEGKTFEAAATEYLNANPPQIRPPDYATGSGKPLVTATEKEQMLKTAQAAMGVK